MNYIKKVLEKDNVSIEELISCFEMVKQNGDVVVIKFDGERKENYYTVFITFPLAKKKEMIRADENNLQMALMKTLSEYIKID